MPRVVHFEIHATDPERAVKFYTTAFGWEMHKWEGPAEYWLIRTGPADQRGIDGGAPRHMEWYAGFAVCVHLVWLYLEVLRLLGRFRSR